MSTIFIASSVPATTAAFPGSRVGFLRAFFRADLRLRALALVASWVIAIATLARLLFFIAFALPSGASAWLLVPALIVGFCNDLVNLLAVMAPLACSLWLLPPGFHRLLVGRVMLGAQLWLGLFAVLFLAVAECFFFKEFNARDPHES